MCTTYDSNTAGLSLSTVVAAPEAASQEAMRVAPVSKGLPVTASGAASDVLAADVQILLCSEALPMR